MAAKCSPSSDGHVPSTIHTTHTTPPIPVYDATVQKRFKQGGAYWLTVKDSNVGALTFQVAFSVYQKCYWPKHYPACAR